jgi:hypothetical protein
MDDVSMTLSRGRSIFKQQVVHSASQVANTHVIEIQMKPNGLCGGANLASSLILCGWQTV